MTRHGLSRRTSFSGAPLVGARGPVGCVPRPRRLLRCAGALLAAVLSLVIVATGPARPAAALGPVSPVVIGTAVRAAPMAGPAAVTCAASVVCGGIVIAGGLGYALYSTRDSWLPAVEGMFNGAASVGTVNGAAGCAMSLDGATPVDSTAVGGKVTADVVYDGSCVPYPGQVQVSLTLGLSARECIVTQPDPWLWDAGARYLAPGSVVPLSGDSWVDQNYPASQGVAGRESMVVNLGCPSGTSPYKAKVQGSSNSSNRTAFTDVTWEIDPTYWTQKTDVTCRKFDGSTFTLSGSEMGHPDRISSDSCYEADPASVPTGATISGPSGPPMVTWTSPDWWTDFPNCFGPSGLLCEIYVAIDGQPCTVGAALCEDWSGRKDDPRLSCQFGAYVVPWERCQALKRSYKPGATPAEVTDPVAWPPDDPSPEPTPTPTPTPSPSSDPNPCNTNCVTPPVPETPPESGEESCMGEAWSWNPVDWVYVPTKCALIWAFVPKVGLSVRLGNIRDIASVKAPFTWLTGIGDIPTAMSGSCPDWRVKIPGQLDKNVVCGSSFTNAIRNARPVFLGFMASLALWPLVRSVMYGSIPIIRATPGKL